MAKVSLRNLTKVYERGSTAVNAVDLDVPDRSFVVLVGPSGCGKTTVLRMIAGLEDVTDGTIHIDDSVVNDVHPRDRDIAMVFQNYALYPHMTVAENLAFALKLRKTDRHEIERRVADAAEILGLSDLLRRKPRQLSGGERQRVALGRAIVRKPRVFLMDEPLSNLDAKLRVQMRAEIARLWRELDTTVIYVTHDQTEAMTMGSTIVVMREGRIEQAATPDEVFSRPESTFVAGFIGLPPMNLVHAERASADGRPAVRIGSATIVLEQGLTSLEDAPTSLVLGLRPEHVSLARPTGDASVLNGRVEAVEDLGSELNVHVLTRVGRIVTREPRSRAVRIGDEVGLRFDMALAHVFRRDSGRRVGC